jgi:hypothetical protein
MNRSGPRFPVFERAEQAIPGISALESPALQNSQREIRSLIEELAQLAHSQAEPEEFYHGFLSRVISAIGASGGAIWQCSASGELGLETDLQHPSTITSFSLIASQQLPSELLTGPDQVEPTSANLQPSRVHLANRQHTELLTAVMNEGGPILVPPGNVRLDVKRPANPLDHSLIIVPVRVQESIEFLIEIIQRPSGGPAAQRGYLRFVAQMADLFADYQRQSRLRMLTTQQQLLREMSLALMRLASSRRLEDRHRHAVQAFRILSTCEHALLIAHAGQPKVVAIADTGSFDSRSELVIEIERLVSTWQRGAQTLGRSGVERFQTSETGVFDAEHPTPTGCDAALREQCQRVCQQLDAEWLSWFPLASDDAASPRYSVLLSGHQATQSAVESFIAQANGWMSFAPAVAELLSARSPGSNWRTWRQWAHSGWLVGSNRTALRVRLGLLVGLLGVACFPVPQRISAPATLRPVREQHYFSALDGVVQQVLVKDSEQVSTGQLLVEIDNIELNAVILRLTSQTVRLRETLAGLKERLGKLGRSNALDATELEFQLHRTESELESVESELAIRQEQRERLSIRARQSGRVSMANSQEEWSGRHVSPHDRLLTIYASDDRWRFEIAVPERRLGSVINAGRSGPNGVSLVINGFPDLRLSGTLDRLAQHAGDSSHPAHSNRPERVVLGDSYFNAQELPVLKDGLLARATIDCGRSPLIWLLVRDAYQATASAVRLWW